MGLLATGWRGPKRGEQDDEILDQIRVGRGLDTGGELLGGSVRAAEMPLGPDDALPVQITGQDAAVLTGASFLPLGE